MLPVVHKDHGLVWYQITSPNLTRHFRRMLFVLIFKGVERLRSPNYSSLKSNEKSSDRCPLGHTQCTAQAMKLLHLQLSCQLWSVCSKMTHFILDHALTIHSLVPILFNYIIICFLPKNNSLKWNRTAWYWKLLMGAFSWKSLHLTGIWFHWVTNFPNWNKVHLRQNFPIFTGWGLHGKRVGKSVKQNNSYITSNLSWSLCCLECDGVNPKIIARCPCLFPRCFIQFLCWKEKNKTVISPAVS